MVVPNFVYVLFSNIFFFGQTIDVSPFKTCTRVPFAPGTSPASEQAGCPSRCRLPARRLGFTAQPEPCSPALAQQGLPAGDN